MLKYIEKFYKDFMKNKTRGESPYLKLTQRLPLGVHPFIALQLVLFDIREQGEDMDHDVLVLYNMIIDAESRLEDIIMYLSKNMDMLDKTATSAKTNNTSLLKPAIIGGCQQGLEALKFSDRPQGSMWSNYLPPLRHQ
ncbi:hypothetical protein C0991_003136 [Blastosporella zonata]|nr:hypothetical protein C0991_003136 [Blastosporella zonata]